MSKDPAFMLYSQDFLVGVSDLTMEERGQYITMLCLQHQKGHLSDKNIKIAVGTVSDDVMSKFIKDEYGMYYNSTLDKVINKREAYSQSRSQNGKKGGRPKKETNENHSETIQKPYAKAYGKHTENENENINEYIIIFEYWNTKGVIKHRTLTEDMQKAIQIALKVYDIEEVKTYIDRYSTVITDEKYFWHYRWSLEDFLTRKDGISAFSDEGSKWVSYCEYLKNAEKKPVPKVEKSRYGNFDPNEAFEAALRRSYHKDDK